MEIFNSPFPRYDDNFKKIEEKDGRESALFSIFELYASIKNRLRFQTHLF
jgi:hypothetical protein